ncbi:MAG: hypothetical protein AB7S61_03205 [Methanoregulaceae archaeon]
MFGRCSRSGANIEVQDLALIEVHLLTHGSGDGEWRGQGSAQPYSLSADAVA